MATCPLLGCIKGNSPEGVELSSALNSNHYEGFDRVASTSESRESSPLLACWWVMSEQLRFLVMDDGTVFFRSRKDDQASPLMRRRLTKNELHALRTNLDEMSVADLPSYELYHLHTDGHQMKMLVSHKSKEFILSYDGFSAGGKYLRLENQWTHVEELAAQTQAGDAQLCSKEVQIPAKLQNAEPGPSADMAIPWRIMEEAE